MKVFMFVLGLAVVLLWGCKNLGFHPTDTRLIIQNNSAQKIVVMTSSDYPDTIYYVLNGCASNDIGRMVEAGESRSYWTRSTWEYNFSEIPSHTLMFLFYNADSANHLWQLYGNCDSLRKRPDLLLKRYDVTLDYLEANNWTLPYP